MGDYEVREQQFIRRMRRKYRLTDRGENLLIWGIAIGKASIMLGGFLLLLGFVGWVEGGL